MVKPPPTWKVPDGEVPVLATRHGRQTTFIIQDGKRPVRHGNWLWNAGRARRMQYHDSVIFGFLKSFLLVRERLTFTFEHLSERRRGEVLKSGFDAVKLFNYGGNLCRMYNDRASCLFQKRGIRRRWVAGRWKEDLGKISFSSLHIIAATYLISAFYSSKEDGNAAKVRDSNIA